MAHKQESHFSALNSLCRFCGCLNLTAKDKKKTRLVNPAQCTLISDKLYFCGIDIRNDKSTQHTQYVRQK